LKIFTPSRGLIAPSTLVIDIPVSYKVPSMMVNVPWVVASLFPFEIKGEANIEGGFVEDPVVKVILEKGDVVGLARGKNFRVKLSVPLSRFSGWERIRIFLNPKEAWASSLAYEEKVLVINPLSLLPIFVLFAILVKTSRRRKKASFIEEERGMVRKEEIVEEKVAAERKKLEGILGIYAGAVDVVANKTGIKQAPWHTIREYLVLVKDKLGEREEDFEFISFLAEKFLYAPGEVSEKEVKEAEHRLSGLSS